jgi:DNA primase
MYDVEKIKQIPLPLIAERETNTVLNTRSNSRCPCPNCGEKGTRFTYYPANNSFKCWYSGTGGTSIDLIKHIRGIDSNAAAIEYLNNMYLNGGAIEPPPMPTPPPVAKPPAKLDGEVYAYLLDLCKGGRDANIERYLDGRGISATLRARYNIRIIPAGAVADVRGQMVKKFGVERLKAAGVISVNGWFVFSEYRLLLPSMYAGKCLCVHGRATDDTDAKPNKYRYLAGVSRVPFLLDNLNTNAGRVYLVEGFFDAVTASELGFPAIGLGSCNYSKELYTRLLSKIKAKGLDVVFAFDNDTAGRNATNTKLNGVPLADYCAAIGLPAFTFKYSDYVKGCKDWNDIYKNTLRQRVENYVTNTPLTLTDGEQPTTEELTKQVAAAVDVPAEIVKQYIETL